MGNEYEVVDKIIFSYFDNKDVPYRVQETIKNTKVKKNTYFFSTYVKRVAIILIIPILFGAMCVIINSNKDDNVIISDKDNILSNTETNDNITETQHEYTIGTMTDYAIGTSPEELYKHSDLTIVGKYVKTNKCFVEELGKIMTESEFEVSEVLKGNYTEPKINSVYYGGVVPLKEYISSLTPEQAIKRGYNALIDEEIEGQTFEGIGLKVYPDTEYVIFLSYNQEKNYYFVLCDGYGMRELSEDGKMYDLDTKTFDTKLTDLK